MKKKMIIINYILVFVCCFSGCKEDKQAFYETTTSTQLTEEVAFVDDIEIPEHLNMTIEGASSRTIIDADIILPDGYKNCNIVECIDKDFTDEDINRYAQLIFDKDSYFVYMPYKEEEKEALIEKLGELRLLTTDEAEQFAFDKALSQLESVDIYYQSDYDNFQDLKFYELYDVIFDRNIWKCDLLGTIDGQYFILSFVKDNTNCYMKLTRFNQSTCFQMYDVGSGIMDAIPEGNVCTYDRKQAETIARDYVKLLGFESMDVVWTSDVRAEYWDKEQWDSSATLLERQVDGYVFYFGRYYENYSMIYSSYRFKLDLEYPTNYGLENEPMFEEGIEYIRVYVDSDGISQIEVYNPLEFSQVLADKPTMISYSDVETIVTENGKNNAERNGYDLRIYEIRLGYDMAIDGNKKALVPVWYVFYDDQSHEIPFTKNVYLRINALDGTVKFY